jgi:hypothetical protein
LLKLLLVDENENYSNKCWMNFERKISKCLGNSLPCGRFARAKALQNP